MSVAVVTALFAAFMGLGIVFFSIYAAKANATKSGDGK